MPNFLMQLTLRERFLKLYGKFRPLYFAQDIHFRNGGYDVVSIAPIQGYYFHGLIKDNEYTYLNGSGNHLERIRVL